MSEAGSRKLMELEALRGVAAVIVLFHHFLLVVAPRLHGRNFPDDPIAMVRTPLFALVNGSAIQSGSLPALPVCEVGGAPAALAFAGLSGTPGLYQLNLTIPLTAANGDNTVTCSYTGFATPAGNLITVQN